MRLFFGVVALIVLVLFLPAIFLFLCAYATCYVLVDWARPKKSTKISDEKAAHATHREEWKEWCYYYNAMEEKEKHGKA